MWLTFRYVFARTLWTGVRTVSGQLSGQCPVRYVFLADSVWTLSGQSGHCPDSGGRLDRIGEAPHKVVPPADLGWLSWELPRAGAAPEWFWTASKWYWPTRAGALCADALARVTAHSAPAPPTQVRALYTNARTLLLPTARRCAFRSRPCASPAQHTSRSLRVRVLQARCHRPGALRASRRSRASFRREGALQLARGTRRPSHWRRHAS